jgi:hypothetical protein
MLAHSIRDLSIPADIPLAESATIDIMPQRDENEEDEEKTERRKRRHSRKRKDNEKRSEQERIARFDGRGREAEID